MQTSFNFGGFESGGIGFEICFVTLYYVSVVFNLVGTIVFLTFRPMNIIYEYGMSPLPAILTLGNARVHVGAFDSGNVWTNIETLVN